MGEFMSDEKKASRPTPVSFSLKNNLSCNVSCGDCVFFTKRANPKYKKPCQPNGIVAGATPCDKFTPDPSKLSFRSDKIARQLARAVSKIGKEHLAIIASFLLRERKTRNKGLHFGQVVYIKVFGGDYLSNYTKAYVAFADRKLVYLSNAKNLKNDNEFTASVGIEHILTKEQWEKKKSVLKLQGRIKDPKLKSFIKVVKKPTLDYEPPTIDSFFKMVYGTKEKKKSGELKTNFVDISPSDDSFDVFEARS